MERGNLNFNITYLLEFMRAENGCEDILDSIGRLTEGMGTFEMPLSYRRFLRSLRLRASGASKLFRLI